MRLGAKKKSFAEGIFSGTPFDMGGQAIEIWFAYCGWRLLFLLVGAARGPFPGERISNAVFGYFVR